MYGNKNVGQCFKPFHNILDLLRKLFVSNLNYIKYHVELFFSSFILGDVKKLRLSHVRDFHLAYYSSCMNINIHTANFADL